MAIIKCKMCGGDLSITEGTTVAECEYCGSVQTVPTVDHEKKLTLFGRANRLRLACEFDKAAGVYESIVAEFPEEAEAYWGLVLCRYGIEYVDDPQSGKKIPTCHRSSFDSIMEDSDFEQTLENADVVARKVYRDEAKAIEELRKGILEVSGKEEPYDIFICYKETDEKGDRTIDSVIAQDVYDALTEKGYRVFFSRISLEDKLGTKYEPYIFAALNSAKVMLAFGTDYEYFNAVWVKNEWSRFLALIAAGQKKALIPCYKGIDAYDMPKEFQRLQAQDMGKVGAIQDLLRGIEKIIGDSIQKSNITAPMQADSFSQIDNLIKQGNMSLEDEDWERSKDLFSQALLIDAKNAEAYLGMAMVRVRARDWQAFCSYVRNNGRNVINEFERAKKYAGEELLSKLNEADKLKEQWAKDFRKKRENFNKVSKLFWGPFKDLPYALLPDGRCTYNGMVISWDGWTDIIALTGNVYPCCLKKDGSVWEGATKIWDNGIVEISTCPRPFSSTHMVGLRSNGTVVAVGINDYGQCNVGQWNNIVAISAGVYHTVGLTSNGTVVATGQNNQGQCNVNGWEDIVAISAGVCHTVGLKSDGTVVSTDVLGHGDQYGQTNVSKWKEIVGVSASLMQTIGVKADGTVVSTQFDSDQSFLDYGQFNVYSWKNIVAACSYGHHTIGVKSDGTLVAVGKNEQGMCNVSGIKLFDNIDRLDEEQQVARELLIRQQEIQRQKQFEEEIRQRSLRKEQLESEYSLLQNELSNLKGWFSGRRRKELQSKLTAIEAELKNL